MNDNTQALDRNPRSTPAPVSGSVVAPQGSLNKEQAPREQDFSEFVRPAGPEVSPNLSTEEKEAGVEVKNDSPNLTEEHKQLGIRNSGAFHSVQTTPSGSIQYPMSEEEIENQLQTGQYDDSGKWLARLIKKIIAWGLRKK